MDGVSPVDDISVQLDCAKSIATIIMGENCSRLLPAQMGTVVKH